MDIEDYISQVENSDLTTEVVEAASDALAFAQSFHEFMSDFGLVKSNTVDFSELEKAFEGFIGEISAASIFLASFSGTEEKLASCAVRCAQDGSPALIANGYQKLSERVSQTRKRLLDI